MTVAGWDSIANVNVLVAVENQFGVKFSLTEMQKLTSVGAYVEAILMKV
jgi:acyl carrier protein